MYEKVTFTNGITDYFYSVQLHAINFICDLHGLDFYNYNDFQTALKLTTN